MGSTVDINSTPSNKFQSLVDSLNELVPTIQQGEATYGILGLVTRLEAYFKSIIEKKLGLRVNFTKDNSSDDYLDHVSIAGRVPVITLRRKFIIDIIKYAKQGNVEPVIATLKSEIFANARKVRSGNIEEDYSRREYIIFEVEAPISGDSLGTLASFQGALPIDKVSLVDTDGETDYVPKEVAKNHFVLKPAIENFIFRPTKDYLQRATLNALYNKDLTENEFRLYANIARNGTFRIIKEHLFESTNYKHKRLGNTITLSGITIKRRNDVL